jgi:hypothetical protein
LYSTLGIAKHSISASTHFSQRLIKIGANPCPVLDNRQATQLWSLLNKEPVDPEETLLG